MEDFIDSWAMRNMDRVSDWEDIGRDRGWSVSGES